MKLLPNKSDGPVRASRLIDVDRYVGSRIRERRVMRGLTQTQFADLIGVTYQQAHKYEKGINRVAASRLYCIARALGVGVDYFYEGISGDRDPHRNHPQQRMMLKLAQTFLALSPEHKKAVCSMARTLAADAAANDNAGV
jgi:transcriptional regulator with XRE-family HTH domain